VKVGTFWDAYVIYRCMGYYTVIVLRYTSIVITKLIRSRKRLMDMSLEVQNRELNIFIIIIIFLNELFNEDVMGCFNKHKYCWGVSIDKLRDRR